MKKNSTNISSNDHQMSSRSLREISTKLAWIDRNMADLELSSTDKNVAYRLAMHLNLSTGQCNPKEETLAKALGKDVRTIKRSIAALKSRGYLSSKRTRSSADYTLIGLSGHANDNRSERTEMPPEMGQKCHLTGDNDVTPQGTKMSRPYIEPSIEPSKEKEESAPDAPAGFSFPADAFDIFWRAYPHRVSKLGAMDAFVETERLAVVSFDALMKSVRRYARKDDDSAWLKPENYLMKRRWEDEPAKTRRTGGPAI